MLELSLSRGVIVQARCWFAYMNVAVMSVVCCCIIGNFKDPLVIKFKKINK